MKSFIEGNKSKDESCQLAEKLVEIKIARRMETIIQMTNTFRMKIVNNMYG